MHTSEKTVYINIPIIKLQIEIANAQRLSSIKQYSMSKHSFPEKTLSVMDAKSPNDFK